MGLLYTAGDMSYWAIWLFILFALMAFNELGRSKPWAGITLFGIVPLLLTIFVWPTTAAPGNEYGTGTWFNIAYDLWNFAYTYNCISDHSAYCGLALLLSCTIPTFFIKRGAWLQHRAQTLGLWIMFIMTVPQFADRIAPIPTTHNPAAFLVVSAIALAFNLGVAIYQLARIRRGKLNPMRDELYTDTKPYRDVVAENR